MYIPDDGEIVVNMWRQTDDRKVWYEWIVEVFALHTEAPPTSASTAKGKGKDKDKESERAPPNRGAERGLRSRRRTRLAVSELHSSIKEACLM
jgi:type II protein arginine methyltransferase